jgi:hypothetical protein
VITRNDISKDGFLSNGWQKTIPTPNGPQEISSDDGQENESHSEGQVSLHHIEWNGTGRGDRPGLLRIAEEETE